MIQKFRSPTLTKSPRTCFRVCPKSWLRNSHGPCKRCVTSRSFEKNTRRWLGTRRPCSPRLWPCRCSTLATISPCAGSSDTSQPPLGRGMMSCLYRFSLKYSKIVILFGQSNLLYVGSKFFYLFFIKLKFAGSIFL